MKPQTFLPWCAFSGLTDVSAAVRVTITPPPGFIVKPAFGDYLTVRTHSPDDHLYSGYTYQVKRDATNPGFCDGAAAGCRFEVLFTLFGRRSHVSP